MSDAHPPVSLPPILRAARNVYAAAIRLMLAEAGCEDMPRNGIYVLGSVANAGAPLSQIIAELDISKQAAGQLVDTLVLRGYLTREEDAEDRRRVALALTPRGAAIAAAAGAVVRGIEEKLLEIVGPEHLAHTRETLFALIHHGAAGVAAPAPEAAAPPRRFQNQRLPGAGFRNCAMPGATFDDVAMPDAVFTNVRLAGAKFSNVNLSNVTIENANITGLTIFGHDVQALIKAAGAA